MRHTKKKYFFPVNFYVHRLPPTSVAASVSPPWRRRRRSRTALAAEGRSTPPTATRSDQCLSAQGPQPEIGEGTRRTSSPTRRSETTSCQNKKGILSVSKNNMRILIVSAHSKEIINYWNETLLLSYFQNTLLKKATANQVGSINDCNYTKKSWNLQTVGVLPESLDRGRLVTDGSH